MPLKRDRAAIEIPTDDPGDLDRVQDIKRTFPGLNIRFAVSLRRDIALFLTSTTGTPETVTKMNENVRTFSASWSASPSWRLWKKRPVPAPMKTTMPSCVSRTKSLRTRSAKAPQTFISNPTAKTRHARSVPGRRRLLRIHEDPSYRRAIVSRLKIMASLDIAERRKPQTARSNSRSARTRKLSCVSPPSRPPAITKTSSCVFSPPNRSPLIRWGSQTGTCARSRISLKALRHHPLRRPHRVRKNHHAALRPWVHQHPDIKIWTAEDPVEITQYGLRQVQVHAKIGFTFAAAMRAFLRADPDVIMVGEMRDKNGGYRDRSLVDGSPGAEHLAHQQRRETITRLLDMGCDSFSFADAMLGCWLSG